MANDAVLLVQGRKFVLVLGGVLAILGSSTCLVAEDALWGVVTANSPTYRIVPRPLPEHTGKHLPYSTTLQPSEKPIYESRPTTPYAYGWFGPRPSPHWSRHFGYQQRYTQWSLK
jgi:hypothetical protein